MPQDPDSPAPAGAEQPGPAPADFDRPSPARAHDWLLGGTLNTAVDRDAADLALRRLPGLRELARLNRAFLHRAVRHLLAAGIRQFLDLGSGLPTMAPAHHVTRAHDEAIPVVYVDHDPTTLAHARLLLEDSPAAVIVDADLRDPGRVLRHPGVAGRLDPDRPLGVLAVDVLDALPDDDHPERLADAYLAALPPGSAFALTHLTADHRPEPTGPLPRHPRPPEVLLAGFAGRPTAAPGVVPPWEWRPDHRLERPPPLAALAAVLGPVDG
ncbi:SAM-dependent methyltransferase [Saccharothrix algeriensis]|uniref:S-adenosyl methyltransferase n=2 Tax=Saccharothrix algeriensis TaxID=173560 RepID=A0ABS2SH92_9PSEU|nr:SAM-dependent methyltransferase [Saccharothrix algeriensis]MBM7815009.1 hypothetical protein [Saccharothrix algeriensis]